MGIEDPFDWEDLNKVDYSFGTPRFRVVRIAKVEVGT